MQLSLNISFRSKINKHNLGSPCLSPFSIFGDPAIGLIHYYLRSQTLRTKGPVINSSRRGGGRHLGGGTKILHAQGAGG